MDIKNININVKITQEQKSRVLTGVVKNRKLFFAVFAGLALAYSSYVIYRHAYVELNFIEYPIASVDSTVMSKEGKTLENIMAKIEERKKNLDSISQKTYKDPFNYGKAVTPAKEDAGGEDSGADEIPANLGSAEDENEDVSQSAGTKRNLLPLGR